MQPAQGRLLTINLDDRSVVDREIPDLLDLYLGGRGIATKLAHDRIPFNADPLGHENRIFISTGPLQQSNTSFTGRMNMTSLSPLTDGLLSTNAGGYLSRNFVKTGYSVVELIGQSDELLAIHVSDEGVDFEPVPELEGAHVPKVTDWMNSEHGFGAENLITIGPAGENLVRFACVITYDTRAFGRGGLGSVLGSKNVKTVSFHGDSPPSIDLPGEIQSEIHRDAATADDMMKRQGTTASTQFINDYFSLPTRYFSEMEFDGVEGINGDSVESKKYKKAACSVCAFACKLPTRDDVSGLETEGPEFETVFSFGSNQGIGDIVDIMHSNQLCDVLGMDTVSAGNTIAAYLASKDKFGDADLVHDLLPKIAHRDGIGDLLAEGVARISDELGVENWTVKGLEFAAHDGRVLNGQGLSYAVANRGADHMYGNMLGPEYNGRIDPDGLFDEKVDMLVQRENKMAVRDSAIICQFGMDDYVTEANVAELLDVSWERLAEIGSHIVELERHFGTRRGRDRHDDRLPYDLPNFEDALDRYYEIRGWNEDGTVEKVSPLARD